MMPASAGTAGVSVRKQAVYSRYVRGEIGLNEMVAQVSDIQPPIRISIWRRAAIVLFTLVSSLVLPHWGARKD